MIPGKCSRSPLTVTGQNTQTSCHLFSLEFETLPALQMVLVVEG